MFTRCRPWRAAEWKACYYVVVVRSTFLGPSLRAPNLHETKTKSSRVHHAVHHCRCRLYKLDDIAIGVMGRTS